MKFSVELKYSFVSVNLIGRAPATTVEPEQPVTGQEPVAKAVKLEPTVPDQPAKPAFTNEVINEPSREKTNNLGFRPSLTQTNRYSHRSILEA